MALEERFYQLERKIFSRLNFPPEALLQELGVRS